MGVANVWSRALVYFGIVEEDEYWDEEAYAAEEELERTYADRDRANVRRLAPRRGEEQFEDWSEPDIEAARTAVIRPGPGRRPPLEAVAAASVRVHLVVPRSFNDAQSIADKFKEAVPVIVNLQTTEQFSDEWEITANRHRHRAEPIERDVMTEVDKACRRGAKEMHQIGLGRLADANLVDLFLGNGRRKPGPGR